MLRGLTTANYFADDLDAAKTWYTEVLGLEPYFEVPGGYIEFRLGDYLHEFGIINSAYATHDVTTSPAGQIVFWAVDDIEAAYQRLQTLGAKPHEGPKDHGGHGYITASVIDPFGNILGVMANPHYNDTLAKIKAGTHFTTGE
ncbi:putative enzyme related to lactoylglutathione lyase [Saccharothrix tamanrassetensis]|uniref:Putative enzyme related to lactoylglutathione lyase n=1 Tax=Saccharothrix tamanrassetensis TaxID=1051531 RepID=A0A841CAT3_9PSEU|nr:VOC family protein [Saccharothrix tamanrassetensis]MBB5953454.1 putative enzyme related to lactoylglutathione lyase [Saccharothrix tamanrassetensis]